ncbi:MAG: hypothetical protein K0U93_03165, partial [Gammaproteobacteria bacterium]|nr:hypothetical protein [Gammaproteobacteria bacterium]
MSMHDWLSSVATTVTANSCSAIAVDSEPVQCWKLLKPAASKYDDAPWPRSPRMLRSPKADNTSQTSRMDCEEDDNLLIRRVCAKDAQALEALYYRFAPRIGRYLHRLLRRREAVEE